MPGSFSPPTWVSYPNMHHGTCVTHVPWCMPGSLTSSFPWSWWRGKRSRHSRRMRNPQIYVFGKRPIDLPSSEASLSLSSDVSLASSLTVIFLAPASPIFFIGFIFVEDFWFWFVVNDIVRFWKVSPVLNIDELKFVGLPDRENLLLLNIFRLGGILVHSLFHILFWNKPPVGLDWELVNGPIDDCWNLDGETTVVEIPDLNGFPPGDFNNLPP